MTNKLKIALGGDHAGYEYKESIKAMLKEQGFEVKDFGTYTSESVDYPDYVHPLAEAVEQGQYDLGVLICGSANGVAMSANKHQGIRAAICWKDELASLARQHNNANVLCLPARFVTVEAAKTMTETFITTPFEGGRHERRVGKIPVKGNA